jgi:hypothetical protein
MNCKIREEKYQIFLHNLINNLIKCRDENTDNVFIINLITNLTSLCVLKRTLKFMQLEKRMTEK